MGLPAAKFDTLSFAKALKDAGVDEKQAEVYAEKQAEIIQMLQDEQLVTKDDIHRLELEIVKTHQEINDVKRDVTQALTILELNLKQEMKGLKNTTVLQLSMIIGGLTGFLSLLHWFHIM
jgi:hypothetical protein